MARPIVRFTRARSKWDGAIFSGKYAIWHPPGAFMAAASRTMRVSFPSSEHGSLRPVVYARVLPNDSPVFVVFLAKPLYE